jgi:L-fuconolactonase
MDDIGLMSERIDAHHHVWDLAVRDQPWMTGDGVDPLRRDFGIDEYIAEAQQNGIAASVVVQTVAVVAETEELLDLAAATSHVIGVVGWVDLGAPDVGAQLDRLLARPSGAWLVGIRSLVQYEPDPDWLARPAVLHGLREVAARGLVNELLVSPHQLGAVAGAASEVGESRFVLDHLGKPAIATAMWEPWATDLTVVAQCENVSAKISGLVTEADWSGWTADDVRPYVDHALSVFGPDRLLFGSDWPVCTLAASYERIVELAATFVDALSAGDRAAVLGGNATKIYSLQPFRREAP